MTDENSSLSMEEEDALIRRLHRVIRIGVKALDSAKGKVFPERSNKASH